MRRGLDDVSLSAVAEAAEVSRPSVYKAFGNRAGLGRACGRGDARVPGKRASCPVPRASGQRRNPGDGRLLRFDRSPPQSAHRAVDTGSRQGSDSLLPYLTDRTGRPDLRRRSEPAARVARRTLPRAGGCERAASAAGRPGADEPGLDRISFTRTLNAARRHVTAQAPPSPSRLHQALTHTIRELLERLLPPRRRRSNPRVINGKMSNWHLTHATTTTHPYHRPTPSRWCHPPHQPTDARNAPRLLVLVLGVVYTWMAQTACGPVVYLGCSVRRSQRPGKDGHSWRKGALPFLACSAPHRLSAYVVAFSADGGRAL
ncbi:helix-turn-helix domain-containing protein [Streptomyces sp. NPDC059442]|uniref:helix-turn-helix domain-containing protein n=1 Tax=Streptomyces sp. NPDC059442 TaxID=3346830 RepID=UPI0036901B44